MGIPYDPAINVAVTDVVQKVLEERQDRKILLVQNKSNQYIVYFSYDEPATISSEGIGPGGNLFITSNAPSDSLWLICDTGKSADVVIREA